MGLWELACLQLTREGILNKCSENQELLMIIERMVAIRKYLDIQERNRKVAQNRNNK